jgi:hypothetical protein
MSRIVSIRTELRDKEILMTCLEYLECEVLYQESGLKMNGADAPVHILAHASFGTLGFRKAQDGRYDVVGDDMILGHRQDLLNHLTQQYAYRKIVSDAQQAGYNLVQEEVEEDRTIKLVVRKW